MAYQFGDVVLVPFPLRYRDGSLHLRENVHIQERSIVRNSNGDTAAVCLCVALCRVIRRTLTEVHWIPSLAGGRIPLRRTPLRQQQLRGSRATADKLRRRRQPAADEHQSPIPGVWKTSSLLDSRPPYA